MLIYNLLFSYSKRQGMCKVLALTRTCLNLTALPSVLGVVQRSQLYYPSSQNWSHSTPHLTSMFSLSIVTQASAPLKYACNFVILKVKYCYSTTVVQQKFISLYISTDLFSKCFGFFFFFFNIVLEIPRFYRAVAMEFKEINRIHLKKKQQFCFCYKIVIPTIVQPFYLAFVISPAKGIILFR